MARGPTGGSGITPDTTTDTTTYQWVVAWILVLTLAMLALRTQMGYKLVYYGLVLVLVFLLVTQYQFITAGLAPIGQPVPVEGGS